MHLICICLHSTSPVCALYLWASHRWHFCCIRRYHSAWQMLSNHAFEMLISVQWYGQQEGALSAGQSFHGEEGCECFKSTMPASVSWQKSAVLTWHSCALTNVKGLLQCGFPGETCKNNCHHLLRVFRNHVLSCKINNRIFINLSLTMWLSQ